MTIVKLSVKHLTIVRFYQIAVTFSKFYHDNRILGETDPSKRSSWISLCTIAKAILVKHLDTLGIETVEVM